MAGSIPSWVTLHDAIAGEVALPDSPAYDQAHQPFNARFHEMRPQAVVLCATPQDVAETISYLGRHGLDNAVRSGGHCFAGHSSTRGVVIDVTPMHSVSVSGDLATVGAGARLVDVYEELQKHDLTIPAGTCPPVGIAGLALGGGLGILGRKYGVTSDHLIRAQIVLADGRILECDENHIWTCSGRCEAPAPATSGWSRRSCSGPSRRRTRRTSTWRGPTLMPSLSSRPGRGGRRPDPTTSPPA